jgi:UDP-3-O-[3-hydroxymyristoyl] glucosamine N-acyltransferase
VSENSLYLGKKTAEIAALVSGKLEGDGDLMIAGLDSLENAGPLDISFLGNPKYAEAAKNSRAGCLLLPKGSENISYQAPSRIYVEDPQYAFSQLLVEVESQSPKSPPLVDEKAVIHYEARLGPEVSISPFVVIERKAVIGERTTIGPHCFIGAGARIGHSCRIYPNVVIRENCVVGDRAIIHSGAVVGSDGFGFSTDKKTGQHRKIPQLGNVVIGDDVEIGSNVSIDRATIGSTVIGDGTKIDNLVQIAHNVRIGKRCLIVGQVGIAGSTQLGDQVILAAQSGVAGHLRVGEGAIIMGQSGIISDVEKGAILFGSPARPRKEAFKLLALYGRLPELFESIKKLAGRELIE